MSRLDGTLGPSRDFDWGDSASGGRLAARDCRLAGD